MYRDDRDTAWSQARGNSEMASKMRKKNQQQQTSKELNDASLSLFICCWAVTNLKIQKINQIIPIIQSKYFSVSAWLNPGFSDSIFCIILGNIHTHQFPGAGGSEAQDIPEGRGVGRLTDFPEINFVSFFTLLWKLLISYMVDYSLIFHIQLELTKFNESMLWIHKNARQSMTFIYRDCQHHGSVRRLCSGMNSVKARNGLPQSAWEISKTTLIVGFMILLSCTFRLLKQ